MTAIATIDRDAIRSMSPEAQREVVGQFIEQGRNMLAQAIAASDIQGVVAAKGAASTVNEMTRQLGLSKEARIDAEELVRRCEYALGKAIRAGQERGEITRKGDSGPMPEYERNGKTVAGSNRGGDLHQGKTSSGSFFSGGKDQSDIYSMTDDVDSEQFEEALTEAKDEGNVSRANVIRKIKDQKSPETRDQRAEKVAEMARKGYTSHDIAARMSLGRQSVKNIASDYDIDIPADRITGKRHRLDSNRIMTGVVETLDVAASSLRQVNPADLDGEQVQEWIDSLTESISAIRKATKTIKESFRD